MEKWAWEKSEFKNDLGETQIGRVYAASNDNRMMNTNKINELLYTIHDCKVRMEDAVYSRKDGLFDVEYGEDEHAVSYRQYEKIFEDCFKDIRKELGIT